MAGRAARGSTLYVTLEPCSTHGRTPPCTEAIIQADFARVVYGAADPNPRNAGRAAGILSRSGVEVCPAVVAEDCAALNIAWNKWIATGMPYVIAKAAMTLDGRINSPPDSRWLTGEASRQDAMKLRRSVQAILVGGETVRADDPQLTVRGIPSRFSRCASFGQDPAGCPNRRLFTDEHRERTLVLRAVACVSTLRELGRRGVASVLIEGGARLLGEAFDRRSWTKCASISRRWSPVDPFHQSVVEALESWKRPCGSLLPPSNALARM